MEAVRNAVARQFGHVFDHQVLWLESLADLLPNAEAARKPVTANADL
jgi:hypothetical protein